MSKRGGFVVAVTVALTVLQAGAAGVAFWLRRDVQTSIVAGEARVGELRREASRPMPAPAVEVAPKTSPWQLHDTNDVTGTMQLLQGLCDGTGTAVDAVKALPAITPGKQAYQLTVRGAPRQVTNLLIELELQQALHVVESGRVTPGGPGMVSLDIAVATWHRGGRR